TAVSTSPVRAGRQTSARRLLAPQAAADLADRLAEPVLVLHQRQPQVALAGVAEAAAGADSHLRLFEQLHGEVDRAHPLAPLMVVVSTPTSLAPGTLRKLGAL